MSFVGLAIFLGILICGAGFFAAQYLFRAFSTRRIGGRWIVAELLIALTGLLLGSFLSLIVYPYSPTARIRGFPFPSMVWELSNGNWLDFVGPLTVPAAAANFVVGLLFPHVLLALVVKWRFRADKSAH